MSKKKEISFFAVMALTCVLLVIYVFPNQIPKSPMHGSNISSWIAPLIGVTVIFITSLYEVFFTFKKRNSNVSKKKSDKSSKVLLISILIVLLYVFIGIRFVGFHISTILFLIYLMIFLGEKRWLLVLGISVGVTIFIHLLFTYYLGINFPKGVLFLIMM